MSKYYEKENFELQVDYLKYIRKYFFQDIYDSAVNFRTLNFYKPKKYLIMI